MKGILIQQKVFKAIDGKYADNVSDDKKLEMMNMLTLPLFSTYLTLYKLDLSKNIDENIDDFTKLIQDIKLTGDKNIDDYSPIVLLNAIPETYGDVKAAIKYGRDNVNLETVVSGLKSKEMDLKTNKPSQNQNEVNFVRVSMANEKLCDVKGFGDVCLIFESGFKLTLKNVRHVPDLCHNLISCAALEEEGLEGRWGKGIMKIMKGKTTQSSLSFLIPNPVTSSCVLDYVHADVWGPANVPSHGGNRFFLSIIDNFSRKVFVFLMKHKSEVFEKFKMWKSLVENQTGKKLKALRTDNGLEFCNQQFSELCQEFGIKRHRTTPYTPQQNGVERMNRTLLNKVRCLLISSGLAKSFWGEALLTAAYLINRSPSVPLVGKVPEHVWSGKNVDLSSLRVFGCSAFVFQNNDKLEPRAKNVCLLVILKELKGTGCGLETKLVLK
ncbi:Retrovirus-related Pol polyprotein from transposon TNT 1-94 [Sesamum angolense]|uniref:Retrovirus-related Pol polyprotein from transposon TNT 1-94 n=1 Tax=Sesamum angolense TaxID=2727404 RepID=A0AAE1WJS4_9LAMI|nr:Retrovirus-related Pol polyprotein from transposon TNT 1-94 [Sesamum angolense]